MNATTTATCTRCGATDVRWATNAAGKRYLANLSDAYDNGRRYLRGPHGKSCASRIAELDTYAAELGAERAHAELVETMRASGEIERIREHNRAEDAKVGDYWRRVSTGEIDPATTPMPERHYRKDPSVMAWHEYSA